MDGQDDGVLSNGSAAPEENQTLNPTPTSTPTLDQDKKGDGMEKEIDAESTINLLRDEIQRLQSEKRELERRLDDVRREVHRTEADGRSLAAQAHRLEGEIVRIQEDLATATSAAEEFEAEADSLKRALKDAEADKAALKAKLSDLEGQLLAAAKGKDEEVRALQTKDEELEMKARDLTEALRLSKGQAKRAVDEQVKITAAREKQLEQVIKALEETNARLEEELAGFRSEIDRNLENEGEAAGLKVSWAVAASVGAVAVVAAAVYLRSVGQR